MISKLDQSLQMHLEITWLIKTDNTKKVCNIRIMKVNLWPIRFKTFNKPIKIHTENNWCMEITINQMCLNKLTIICTNKWWRIITMEIWIICMIKWVNKNKTKTNNKTLKNPKQLKWLNNNSSHSNRTIINKGAIFIQDITKIIINKDTNKDNIITETTIITSNNTITIIIKIRID